MEQLLKNNMMTKIKAPQVKPSWNVKFAILVMKPSQVKLIESKLKKIDDDQSLII
jgi:hypothetical protein